MNTSKTIISLSLSIILVTGTITALSSSSFMRSAQAQPSYYNDGGMDYNNNYYQKSYSKDNYKSSKDSSRVDINKIKCINGNININGINSGDVNAASNNDVAEGNPDGYSYDDNGHGSEGYNNKQGKDIDCLINNNNNNTNIAISEEGNQTVTPQEPEPEPTTATLTVKKQVFGCDNLVNPFIMDCTALQNDSPAWLDCNNSNITNSIFCQSLPESIFDIEVLDDQNNQIQQFVGSEQGTTIENLDPGTYTVNEIENPTFVPDQLVENPSAEGTCIITGFTDGGQVFNVTSNTDYGRICFEYEDEQGNDCSTISLAAGEERTCTVKNHIRFAQDN